jgi:hypothetical protein
MKFYMHFSRIIVRVHTLRARSFSPSRWTLVLLLGYGKTHTLWSIIFSEERMRHNIHFTHIFPNFFEYLLHLNACGKCSVNTCLAVSSLVELVGSVS